MKKTATLALAALSAITMFTSIEASAGWGRDGYYRGGDSYYGGGYYRGGHRSDRSYRRGVRHGLLASSAGLATSEAVDKKAIYLGADEDAALYLADVQGITPILREAMDIEREMLLKHNYTEVNDMDDHDLAYMVMGRAAQLK